MNAYNEAIRLDPENTVAWSGRGVALKSLLESSEDNPFYDEGRQ
ncbi:MAG: hypothetical protein ACP5OU_09855 [Methanothrix sp.]